MLKESLTDASRSTFHLLPSKRPSFFSILLRAFGPFFLEKLSLISLLKSDLKIHVFAFLTLSNKKLAFFKKKKKTWCPFSHVIERKRCPFLTLFRFGGSRGGPLGETPSPSRPTWLSETPSLGVGGGRRARTGESGRNRLELGWGPARGARSPAPRPPPNSPKIP